MSFGGPFPAGDLMHVCVPCSLVNPAMFHYDLEPTEGLCFCNCIGVGAQSTLGGHDIFARKICMKN